MTFNKISLLGGQDKDGASEAVSCLDIYTGNILAVVGPTGSGKTQLISDIEQYADGETPTRRQLLIDDRPVCEYTEDKHIRHLVAEVSQKMNFIIDTTVYDFLTRHARVRGLSKPQTRIEDVIDMANTLAGEPLSPKDNLTSLSGGQTRALMVGDVALISNAPIVLIDEIENAGIDRLKALECLSGQGKIVLVVTHDLTLALMSERRVIMKNGGMSCLHQRSEDESKLLARLLDLSGDISALTQTIKSGRQLTVDQIKKENRTLWPKF